MFDAMTTAPRAEHPQTIPEGVAEARQPVPANDAAHGLPHLVKHCNAYKGARTGRAVFQLTTTLALFALTTAIMIATVGAGAVWATLLLALPAGGLLVRLFIIQHDCGHMSFFKKRRTNDIVGSLLSLLTFTPYAYWRDAHNMHHSGSGNLTKRSIGAIDTLTVAEYQSLDLRQRFVYRFYRNPLVVLVFGPPLHILILQRLPLNYTVTFIDEYRALPPSKTWRSILALNIALVALYAGLISTLGFATTMLVFIPPVVVAACTGGWLFFIQHQFENTYWQRGDQWNFQTASVLGSSYYVLPKWLQWFTGNIGLHHIHHLCSLIPNYRLQECLDASPELQQMNRLTIRESLYCAQLALWDEPTQKMIRFKDMKAA